MKRAWVAGAIILGMFGSASGALEPGAFAHPPDSDRPWVYWFWKNGNISREGITADLEAMERVGIGGVILMEVSLSVPPGNYTFFTPEWRELFAHAVSESARLGLQFTLNSGPGWTGSGGPWVTPEQSMQKVVASETTAVGSTHFDAVLPQPEMVQGFYRDIAVLAFPTLEGERGKDAPATYRIPKIEEKALYKRGAFSSQPGVPASLPGLAEYETLPESQVIPRSAIMDLTASMQPDGRLVWDAPEGDWTIMRFGHMSTGQTNRPSPLPGLECDKLDPAALDAHFQQFIVTLIESVPVEARKAFVATHLDSWEVGAQNWTGRFREEFQRRRGYDLLPYLPAMTGRVVENLEISERFLWDLRQTVSEMIVEHGHRLRELAAQHGLWFSIEPYDMNPADDMTLGSTGDVPMCEFWSNHFDTRYSVKELTSVAHVYGKPVIAAEAFTSVDRWLFHPGTIKPLGDWAFCEGINRFVLHRYVHQPFAQARPGLSLGPHGLHYERTNTWWEFSRPWHEYLARCQYTLRQGLFVADVLYMGPEGAPNVFQSPDPAPAGYKFDACTPDALLTRVSVKDGRIVLPNGAEYRLLVLPNIETMTPALLRKISELAAQGAPVLGNPPKKSPSLSGYPACDDEVSKITAESWQRVTPAQVAPGAVYPASTVVEEQLRTLGVLPDFESDQPLRFAHRREGDADLYFVSNGASEAVLAKCFFRTAGRAAERWHPEDGSVETLGSVSSTDSGCAALTLHFDPAESYFVRFTQASSGDVKRGDAAQEQRVLLEIVGPWEVTFDPSYGGLPEKVNFDQLQDWSERPEPEVRYYSGPATYTTSFELATPPPGKLMLDLGRVEVMAAVRVNGKAVGIAWKSPNRVDISRALRPGMNALEVKVVNLWPNRMIGDEMLPPDSERNENGTLKAWPQWLLEGKSSPTGRQTFSSWRHWSKDDALLPSGLLGPVRVQLGMRN
ncbi:MAG: glycosyl hydrolase [Candidatus Hydrogenedentes bacterium]|nr:glycosyl hydrolase [Candidatus Hydrogenedentota bacterium]